MRVFFAIDLPISVKAIVGEYIAQLKKAFKYNNIRWVRPQNLHLTLQFLEKIEPEQLPALIETVRRETDKMPPFSLALNQLAMFSSANHSRVIFLDVEPKVILDNIASRLRESIKAAGHPVELRPFRGHITLGRINFNAVKNFSLPPTITPTFEEILVQEITLLQTLKSPEGHSQYQPLEHFKLKCRVD